MRKVCRLWSKPPNAGQGLVERGLPGMAERAVAEIVGKGHGLGQVLVDAECPGHGAGDLRHLERVGEPRAEMIALEVHEDLGLVLEATERDRVHDPVAVALVDAAQPARRLRDRAPQASLRGAGIGLKEHASVRKGPPRRVDLTINYRCINRKKQASLQLAHEDFPMTVTDTRPAPISLSASAARRIAAVARAEGAAEARLRVSVSGGGCSGFQYQFALDDKSEDGDIVVERDGAALVVDGMSLMYVLGAELDFVEDLTGSYFKVTNPNASSSCGCGTSFAI